MIQLKPFDQATITDHLAELRKNILSKLANNFSRITAAAIGSIKSTDIQDYLRDHIDTILTGEPKQLRTHIVYFEKTFGPFQNYVRMNPRSGTTRYKPYYSEIAAAIRGAFDYDGFSKNRDGWGAYRLVAKYRRRLCPYCNLNHVNFHYNRPQNQRKISIELEMRPPLDHFYPRGDYPYLGVSLYNLIPSCHQCNSSVKLQKDPFLKGLLHPLEFASKSIRFSLEGITNYGNPVAARDIKLKIECANQVALAHVDFFALGPRYAWYTHEIEDMHKRYLSSMRSANVVEHLLQTLGYQNIDREERALGICLHDIFQEFEKSLSK